MTFSTNTFFLCRVQEKFPDSEMAKFAAYCQTSLERTKRRFVGNSWNKEKFRCYEAKIEKRPAVTGNRTQDTWLVQPVLCH